MSYAELLARDRRLVLLRLLDESAQYTANEYLLGGALPGFGHSVSQDTVRGDLAWLAKQGLVTTQEAGGLLVATLTSRGSDIANGRGQHPGVQRPRPEG